MTDEQFRAIVGWLAAIWACLMGIAMFLIAIFLVLR